MDVYATSSLRQHKMYVKGVVIVDETSRIAYIVRCHAYACNSVCEHTR